MPFPAMKFELSGRSMKYRERKNIFPFARHAAEGLLIQPELFFRFPFDKITSRSSKIFFLRPISSIATREMFDSSSLFARLFDAFLCDIEEKPFQLNPLAVSDLHSQGLLLSEKFCDITRCGSSRKR
jgi:hypothetical protein